MGCFDGEGETKEIGEKQACAYHYTVSEINGEKSYKIKREVTDAADASEYPRTKVEENCKLTCFIFKSSWLFTLGSQICTDSSCNDKDAKDWFGVTALLARVRRSPSLQFMIVGEETTTATKPETTTTTTTTAPPDFSCYICNLESAKGNYSGNVRLLIFKTYSSWPIFQLQISVRSFLTEKPT